MGKTDSVGEGSRPEMGRRILSEMDLGRRRGRLDSIGEGETGVQRKSVNTLSALSV